MAIHQFMVNTYARNVYALGTRKLSTIPTEPDNYRQAVVEHAAKLYDEKELQRALDKGFITSAEHAETLSYKTEVPDEK